MNYLEDDTFYITYRKYKCNIGDEVQLNTYTL